ncbi:ABC transporter ATP-binding protein [Patescibacteria group bacterium]|nr:ABC transporter ATP-binding protein [Patescibacteria group bacterium]
MTRTPSVIALKKITRAFVNDEVVTSVLHGITLEIDAGEFVALMGPSGSGKSTLMQIMAFLDHPTTGEYHFRGKDVSRLDDDALALLRLSSVGFVFQAFNLLPKATVLENVMLPLTYAGVRNGERRERATEALVSVGLKERLTYYPNQLSGGQKQRVAIARALVNNPDVLFADEPTGNLDSASSEQVMTILRDLHRSGKTIVMVTHEPDIAEYAKRIVRLKDGMILSDRTK